MSVQVLYGGYLHPENEAAVTVDVSTVFSPAKFAVQRLVRWTIEGIMIGSGPVELASRQALLEAAYATNYLDCLQVETSTGAILQGLTNASSYTGVRVTRPPSFPKGDGAEFATERHYSIVLEAEYELNVSPEIVDYKETITMGGGGPLIAFVECITGPSRKQILKEQTAFFARQSGYAVGRRFPPPRNQPIFPADLFTSPETSIESAGREGLALRNNRITWNYEFRASYPLIGNPIQWPLF